MSDRWQLGSYTFTINPNKYGESVNFIGDNAVALDGTVISMPTVTEEQYNFSSTLYQGMPRVLSQVSMPNATGVKMQSGNYYVANNSTKKIDQYNSNFSLIKSTSTGISGSNIMAFDIAPNGNFYVLDDASGGQKLHTVTSSGNTTTTLAYISAQAQGIKYDSGDLWVVDANGKLYETDLNFNIINQVTLTHIDPATIGYRGMEIVGNYLVVSVNNTSMSGAYHIDRSKGNIVNVFSLPTSTPVIDVTYDGSNFIFLTQTSGQLIYTNGNTLYADIYTIENNIRDNGFLYMIDDMGVKRKVTVSNYSIDRADNYLTMYNVQITVSKIDRG